jgi:murein DD-endopeptidase MepM/ murein hydrolase activator NlpD
MSSFQPADRPRRAVPVVLVGVLLLIAGIGAAAWFLKPRFESDPPQIKVTPTVDVIGLATPLEIVVSDPGTGLRSVRATLTAGGAETVLASEDYAQPVHEKRIALDPAKLKGLKEGPATLRVTARDASLWNSFKGNEAALDKPLTIDVTPPTIELVADDRYINFGGVGALVYESSPDTVTSGVKIGEYFFPGFQGAIRSRPDDYFVLFAHPYNADPGTKASLVATDRAGNTSTMAIAYELKNVKYRKSTIALTDAFLQNKVAPLTSDVAVRQGPVKELFIAVNKGVRKQNEDKITEITKKATPRLLWQGAFTQLSNSKVEANFADARTYTYNGEVLDTAYHLGYDLSVTKHYPVEAANSGAIAFTGDLGLYGNAVIIDHGMGLFTLYGHLSSIDVKEGDRVANRQVIGRTGETGFAGGDHLHYGVYLDGVAVLPVEWWDAKWIRDNIEPKLEGRGEKSIAQAQQPAKAPSASHKKAATHRKHR